MQKQAAERYIRSIYADMVRAVAQLLGYQPVQAHVEFGNKAAVAAWGRQNSFHHRGAAAETANGMTIVSSSELKNADEADLRGMIAHEVSHLYGTDETAADAVRYAINGNRGSLKGSYDKWQVSAASKSYAETHGYVSNSSNGGSTQASPGPTPGGGGGSGGGGGDGGDNFNLSPGAGNATGNYAEPGGHQANGGNGGGGGGGGGHGGGDGAAGQGADPGNTQPSNPYLQDIAAFISGSKLRNQFSQDDWDGMLAFAHHVLNSKGNPMPDGTQPLELFAGTYAAFKMSGTFKDLMSQGISAKVWVKDPNGWNNLAYTSKVGAVGSGAAGKPPPQSGVGQPPNAPPGSQQSTHQDIKNNEANMELWLQKAGIPVTPAVQQLIDEAGKKGWDIARFELAVENQTKVGQAYLDQQQAYKESAFIATINSLQMSEDKNIQNLIQQAATHNWSGDQFTQALYDTPEFQKAFPGIFNKDGSLRMQPSQYLADKVTFASYADQAGINLGDNKMAWLFRNEVSPDEFKDRAQAIQILRDNKQYFEAFNQQMRAEGKPTLTKGDQLKFVLGEGSAQWYKDWQRTTTRYAGEQAGIGFGKPGQAYTNISEKQVQKIAGKGFDLPTMQKGFADLATKLQTTLPESALEKGGVTKRDLVELEFGGPRSAAIQKKVDQITANLQAYQDYQPLSQGANPNLGSNQGGSQQKYGQGP